MHKTYDYKYLRARFKPRIVDKLPEGQWVTVSVASSILKKSKQSIRLLYLRGEVPAIKFKRSPILVNIDKDKLKK